jgi:hypothetical protein
MAKYNQLLRIEEELGDTAYFPGKKRSDKIIVLFLYKTIRVIRMAFFEF